MKRTAWINATTSKFVAAGPKVVNENLAIYLPAGYPSGFRIKKVRAACDLNFTADAATIRYPVKDFGLTFPPSEGGIANQGIVTNVDLEFTSGPTVKGHHFFFGSQGEYDTDLMMMLSPDKRFVVILSGGNPLPTGTLAGDLIDWYVSFLIEYDA